MTRDKVGADARWVLRDVLIHPKAADDGELQSPRFYQSYTARRSEHDQARSKSRSGLNMEMGRFMVKWVEDKAGPSWGTTWPKVWSPKR